MGRIINVANRLPVTIGSKITKSSGGLVSALDAVRDDFDMLWLGWPGKTIENKNRQRYLKKVLLEKYGCLPVFLDAEQIAGYYHGFSNSTLWPLLHYRSQYLRYGSNWWQTYRQVNQQFADTVLSIAKPGDLVWVHDYHLMLLPQMLKESRKGLKVGFFLHTPFPSYEIFRCHPQRKELLAGLIAADLVGFHTFGYMRHFRSAAARLLGAECQTTVISQHGTKCHTGVFPIGADVQAFTKELNTDRLRNKLGEYEKIYLNKKIVLSVERLDYSKGIIRRLEAIDRFLSEWPDKDDIVFIFIAVPSRGEVPDYVQLRQEVQRLVGRLNGKHATIENIPIHFINKSIGFTELCALYRLADVAMVTPLIDGMNMVAKEFVACRPDFTGALILSEFTGAADELFQAFIVNPYDRESMVECLRLALTVPKDDIERRMKGMYQRVTECDAKYWAKSFVSEMEKIEIMPVVFEKKADVATELKARLKKSTKTAFFLDYDGTLRDFQNDHEKAVPTAQIMKLVKALESRKNTDTYIISGRKEEHLEQWFAKYNVTLVAEHGFSYRRAGSSKWQKAPGEVNLAWKDHVRRIFNQYSETTPGSFVEEKASAIVWHYRQADPEFGKFKADQLAAMLQEMMANMPVEVHSGKKIVEVCSMQVNKGLAVMRFARANKYDLILCAGDDQTDESMFRLTDKRLFKIKVGHGETNAEYRVDNCDAFIKLLMKAVKAVK